MLRVRFHANEDDPRPVIWPIKHPYWVSGSGNGYSIIVAYVESLDEVTRLWPEADEIEILEENAEIRFTDRFSRPEWYR